MNIGGCWLKEKDGNNYFSCQIRTPDLDLNFAIFKNAKKEEGTNQPDYNIVWSPPKKDNGAGDNKPAAENPFSDDKIPF
jgi:uncharacterized protein (DUF736 family)